MKYSQSNEQDYILDYFRDITNGRFLDVGAFHVFQFSNVRALFECGWGGTLVEPAPANYKAIAEHYANEERIKVLNIAIGETTGEVDFYESNGDAVGTTDEGHMTKWGNAGVKYTKIRVPQVSVVDFMNEHCKDVDFLSIDTESTNIAVFRNIPEFVFKQIKMICIEHDQHQDEIKDVCSGFGLYKLYENAENIILAKR